MLCHYCSATFFPWRCLHPYKEINTVKEGVSKKVIFIDSQFSRVSVDLILDGRLFSLTFLLSVVFINAGEGKSITFLCQQQELSTKLVLNAVSTGAHVLKGKIYQNHMIDLQVTNTKLYRRATRLLQVL